MKAGHQHAVGHSQALEVSVWKWDSVFMDFVIRLSKIRGKNNVVWVIGDRLTKSTHYIAVASTWTLDQQPARVYLNEIVCLHRVPSSTVSDRDTRF